MVEWTTVCATSVSSRFWAPVRRQVRRFTPELGNFAQAERRNFNIVQPLRLTA
ncbi:MAG: hypothetical protein HQL78_14225 [Magnetococcales bacterium]|nr:hypothetical protein [Magnetococcales bacterium]